MKFLLLALLAAAASVSPLLTVASLWQIKEWRIDRLREHMHTEGWLRQLFGITRPAVVVALGALSFFRIVPQDAWPVLPLATLLALAAMQILLRRQPMPVWTRKAATLTVTALLLTCAVGMVIPAIVLPVLPLLQPLFLCAAWSTWFPVDRALKRRVMQRAMLLRRQHSDLTVVGITGSVGKTTVKELIAHLLREQTVLATPEHVNSEMGVAQWLLAELPKHPAVRILVVEMGAYRIGEIKRLCEIMHPALGVVTFIGSQHIGLFGSQAALCAAKGELVASLPHDGHAFLNADSALCAKLAENTPCPVTSIGTGGHVDLEAFDIEETSNGIRFRIAETPVTVPLHGTHNVTNVLLSIAVARHLGLPLQEIVKRLTTFQSAAHTFSVRKERGVTLLDDTHNASPASFKAAINWARSQPFETKILLTGGLIELGEEQDRTHAELGTLAVGIFDRVIFTNKKNARSFERGYGNEVEIYSKKTRPVAPDALLVCIGRIPSSLVSGLLP